MRVKATHAGKAEINLDDFMSLRHVQQCGVDYSGRVLEQFGATGCRFEQCNFSNVRFNAMAVGGGQELCQFINCNFDGAHLVIGPGGFTRFMGCSFRNVRIREWICFQTELIDCAFTGRLQTCIFNGAVPEEDRSWVGRSQNEFRGNDFSGAELLDVSFRTGIDLNQQKLPSGPNYLYVSDGPAAIARAESGLVDWMPGSEWQRLAQAVVSVKAKLVADGQQQFLMNLGEYRKGRRKYPPEVMDKVASLFRGDCDSVTSVTLA